MNNNRLQITTFGQPSVLNLAQEVIPAVKPGQVVVKVAFAGINPVDAKTRAGLGWAAERCKDQLPWTPGFDFSGEVVAVADDVKTPTVGDRVAGVTLDGGCYSEFLAVNAQQAIAVPESVQLDAAAAAPLAALTAHQALQHGKLESGERVLILAGAGGVGHLAIQLAKEMGAQVYASCSSPNVAFVQALGANALDYTKGDLDIEGVDLLVDLVGGEVGMSALSCVKKGGRVVTVPSVTAPKIKEQAAKLSLSATGMLIEPRAEECSDIFSRLAEQTLTVHISDRFVLANGHEAHKAIETGRTRGKLVLTVSGKL